MFPQAETVCQFGMIHHQQLQAEATQGHRIAQIEAVKQRLPLTARMRLVVGAALVDLGERILDPSRNASRGVMLTIGSGRTSLT
jgi:hypothetical protein